jgi:hypothetical protein
MPKKEGQKSSVFVAEIIENSWLSLKGYGFERDLKRELG